MPFYDYLCPDCSSEFFLQRTISQRDEPTECPDCTGKHSVRQIAIPMVMTRGEDGSMQSLSSSACGGCTTTSCGGCPSAN